MAKTKPTAKPTSGSCPQAELLDERAAADERRAASERQAEADARKRLEAAGLGSHAREILQGRVASASAEAARRTALAAAGRAGAAALRGQTGRA